MRFRPLASAAILALGLALPPALSAQTAGAPPSNQAPRGAGRLQAAALQGITLTAAQQSKIDSIAAKTRAQMPPMTPGAPPSDADRQKMQSVTMASLKEVRAVLTPGQQKTFDKNVTEIQERIQQRMAAPPPATK
jgi:Spy/CpxP family protein refolding chaperone